MYVHEHPLSTVLFGVGRPQWGKGDVTSMYVYLIMQDFTADAVIYYAYSSEGKNDCCCHRGKKL